MPSEVRICPHCGASVSGSTDQCPRCDGWLNVPPSATQIHQNAYDPASALPTLAHQEPALSMIPTTLDEEEAEVLLLRPGVSPAGYDVPQTVDDVSTNIAALDDTDKSAAASTPRPDAAPIDSSWDKTVVLPPPVTDETAYETRFDVPEEVLPAPDEPSYETHFNVPETPGDAPPEYVTIVGEPNVPSFVLVATNFVPEPLTSVSPLTPATPPDDSDSEPIGVADSFALATEIEGQADLRERLEPPSDELEARREATPTKQPYMPEDSGPVALPDLPDTRQDATPPQFQPENTEVAGQASFENAKTAPIPTGSTTFPRPGQPVPEPEPLPAADTQPKMQAISVPAAPYTPPPLMPAPATLAAPTYAPPPLNLPPAAYTQPPANYMLQQRLQAYLLGKYQLQQQKPNEIILSYGKPLSFFWWVAGMASVVGILWYFFILLLSGFRRDVVYVVLEPDGFVYEEGPGAAHIRRRRSRTARRWGVIGIVLSFVSLFTIFLIVLAATALIGRYKDELNAAYPEFGLFDSNVNPDTLDRTQVQNVKVMVLALTILGGLSIVGVVGGLLMSIVSYLHSSAFKVDVAPLPDLR